MLSRGGGGGGTGFGSDVGVAVLSGRKMVLKPFPTQSPTNAESGPSGGGGVGRSEEHTSELQSLRHLVCRLLPEKKTGRTPIRGSEHTRHLQARRHRPCRPL